MSDCRVVDTLSRIYRDSKLNPVDYCVLYGLLLENETVETVDETEASERMQDHLLSREGVPKELIGDGK